MTENYILTHGESRKMEKKTTAFEYKNSNCDGFLKIAH